ncbi:MAG: hypothetical protein J4A00_10760, partial [Gammaproteobacteria bacterium]|nr:hypothetical protein [Gammaproteobacteria bacterium]
MTRKPAIYAATLSLLLLAVYWPGLHGPFLFDDYSNILNNPLLRIDTIDFQALKSAALSLASGPLNRPVAALSFALNYHFAGGYSELAFKATNLMIHGLSTLVLFWLCRQVVATPAATSHLNPNRRWLIPLAVTAAWALHPIQLTSVLYVVQRMTALAGLFAFLTLGCYLRGRLALAAGNRPLAWLFWGGIAPLTFTLGLYSKESTVLVLVLIPLFDWILLPEQRPWRLWQTLNRRSQHTIAFAGLALLVVIVSGLTSHFAPQYGARPFDLSERLMTESRVVWFYLSLILFPQLTRFGLYHDDIPISQGIFEPVSTLPSILGLLILLVTALSLRKRQPLIALGLFWFLGGHLLESTFIPLEIAHEHRNYLPSAGLLLALVGGVAWAADSQQKNGYWLLLPLVIISL